MWWWCKTNYSDTHTYIYIFLSLLRTVVSYCDTCPSLLHIPRLWVPSIPNWYWRILWRKWNIQQNKYEVFLLSHLVHKRWSGASLLNCFCWWRGYINGISVLLTLLYEECVGCFVLCIFTTSLNWKYWRCFRIGELFYFHLYPIPITNLIKKGKYSNFDFFC